ncbi:hypothetical protein T07_4389 [Trichinella nelsoni]|uniref:Uncharacterized protein n=1 Tax=Trichinella nelsoni TaxID=6336 RepID=A0A0V0RUA1_9BILA|nr:hypothetical protein T07_4389 [Trichinella nelsoni]
MLLNVKQAVHDGNVTIPLLLFDILRKRHIVFEQLTKAKRDRFAKFQFASRLDLINRDNHINI